ncbi:AcrR family transcriptional regulator [Nocardia transvalensis]|uniref:AcrR family transcriptional regulator n=1 Tax=Nocardia transvalensis TaxID=37333 RepID=A0A7W9UH60_9NOCA|nr:QsdR family transcriptional regulator [Nocardia transvalensis]MBB5913009.1 AcrR family transcriptional regulator [Nocardia transvalensis]
MTSATGAHPTPAYLAATGERKTPSRATPAEAFAAARHRFLHGERLDMGELATELRVSRTTLYRWTGDRDRLLADVVWFELHRLVENAIAAAPGSGLPRLRQGIEWFLDATAQAAPLRALLATEGERAVRMLTAPNGPIRPRLVGLLTDAIEQEVTEGNYRPPAPPATLADGIVALGERYLHNGGDPTLNPDPATAHTVIALLLREEGISG